MVLRESTFICNIKIPMDTPNSRFLLRRFSCGRVNATPPSEMWMKRCVILERAATNDVQQCFKITFNKRASPLDITTEGSFNPFSEKDTSTGKRPLYFAHAARPARPRFSARHSWCPFRATGRRPQKPPLHGGMTMRERKCLTH